MSLSPETCPFCHQKMLRSFKTDKPCPLLVMGKISFVEHICSKLYKVDDTHQEHVYFQISSPEQEIWFQKICLIQPGIDISLNHKDKLSFAEIYYRSHLEEKTKIETLQFPRLIAVNFKDISSTIKHVKNLLPFV
jgi:hypothetical protein